MNLGRFTDRSRRVLAMAGDEANARGADAVEPQHLLLGLLRASQSVAQAALGYATGLDHERYSAVLPAATDPAGTQRELPFSEQSELALRAAVEELAPLGHSYVGTEHLLLGLARVCGGPESLDLASLGTSFSEIRAEVYGILGHDPAGEPANKMSAQNPFLEVCIGSLPDALAAEMAGANRLELCGALELGGLTPSLGLVEQVIGETILPVVVMLRPRAGGFAYRDDELAVMIRDARHIVAAGAGGVVFGVLTADARIDREATARLVDAAAGKEAVVHRAFDFVADPGAALEELIELGVTRVLTTGGPPTALNGADALAALIEQAAGRIEILPGGGVTAAGVGDLVRRTGCTQVHVGAATSAIDPSLTGIQAASLSDLKRLASGELRTVDAAAVAAVRAALDQPPV